MKRVIIIGATSGLGRETAKLFVENGWKVGIAGRREDLLCSFADEHPLAKVECERIDVTEQNATDALQRLIEKTGGMDLMLLSSGIGYQNRNLVPETELATVRTNCEGFTRIVDYAFNYFKSSIREGRVDHGHIAVISSIAGTKGLGAAPAYSATKRFQNTYIEALSQLATIEGVNVGFTDIRPGFVATALLRDTRYPMLMDVPTVARHIFRAIVRRKKVAVIDWRYAILVAFWRLIPRALWIRLKVKN